MGKKIPNYYKANHVTTGLIEFDDEKCTRCGICLAACGGGGIEMPPKIEGEVREAPYLRIPFPDISVCVACGDCVAACPNQAIKITRGFTVNKPYFYARLVQIPVFTYPRKY